LVLADNSLLAAAAAAAAEEYNLHFSKKQNPKILHQQHKALYVKTQTY
jgi:hypothetical protein